MRYIIAFVFPPGAVLFYGGLRRAILNVFLTLCLWVPGVIHALAVVNGASNERSDIVATQMRRHRMNSVIRRA
jgi:uncharacterized membrane protein YqaE (UPF0057 family)